MTSWQITRLVAGSFILLSLALGMPGSPLYVSQWWLAFTAFVGAELPGSRACRRIAAYPAAAKRRRPARASGSA